MDKNKKIEALEAKCWRLLTEIEQDQAAFKKLIEPKQHQFEEAKQELNKLVKQK